MKLTKGDKEVIITKILNDLPQTVTREEIHSTLQKEMDKLLPKELKAYKDTDQVDRIRLAYKSFWGSDKRECVSVNLYGYCSKDHDVLDKIARPMIDTFYKELYTRQELKDKLTTAFAGITTLKKAIQIFPEFEQYFPKPEEKTANLPIHTDVIVDLMHAGWPKNKPKKRKATA